MNQKRDRLTILASISPIVGNDSGERKVEEIKIFCIEDGEPILAEFWQPSGYKHKDHINDHCFYLLPYYKMGV